MAIKRTQSGRNHELSEDNPSMKSLILLTNATDDPALGVQRSQVRILSLVTAAIELEESTGVAFRVGCVALHQVSPGPHVNDHYESGRKLAR